MSIDRPCLSQRLLPIKFAVACPKISFLEAALRLQAKEKDREARSMLMKRVR